MMETLRGWLLGLTAAALAVSLLTAMLPKGETIRRIASMKPAAPDFLLMWDNAYCIHEFEGDYVPFPDILSECASTATPTWSLSLPPLPR